MTPTYVPAIINTAYVCFQKKGLSIDLSLQQASQFMCQLLQTLYSLPQNKRISCMNLAKEASLQPILDAWQCNHSAIKFGLNDNAELTRELAKTAPLHRPL